MFLSTSERTIVNTLDNVDRPVQHRFVSASLVLSEKDWMPESPRYTSRDPTWSRLVRRAAVSMAMALASVY